MYESFYHLQEKPFRLSPDPRFFFGSTGHKRVLAYLRYGVRQGEGFIIVTGEVGAGKTTLIHTLLEELAGNNEIITAHVVNAQSDVDNLFSIVAGAFGLAHKGLSNAVLQQELITFLTDQVRQGKRALLIVDEAQGLNKYGLEALRLLTNFQVNHKSLVQSFLVGQAEFRKTLQSGQLEQLRQRVIASCHLGSLELNETKQYIEHRLNVAGWKGDPVFTPEAYNLIQEYSAGIPRRIGNLCDRALLVGCLEEVHTITKELVSLVIKEIKEEFLEDYYDEKLDNATITAASAVQLDKVNTQSTQTNDLKIHSGNQTPASLEARVSALEEIICKSREAINALLKGGNHNG